MHIVDIASKESKMRKTILLLVVVAAVLFGTGVALATATYADRVRGIETSAGNIVGDTRVGATFIGEANGDLPGSMRASINYTPPRPGPGVTNRIVGGKWSLRCKWGVLRGSFTGGAVRWNSTATKAAVNARMKISGGTVRGERISGGSGRFKGTLNHRTFPPAVRGTLTLRTTGT